MSPLLEVLGRELKAGPARHYCVALSGGLDSTALLHGLCQLRGRLAGLRIRAVHINHGLHPQAAAWETHCAQLCRDLDVPLQVEAVAVARDTGLGLEAAARTARYATFAKSLAPDECLLTAHHQDDQLETFLLRLMRGAGPHGLAGIAIQRRCGPGWLLRPLLGLGREALQDYANTAGLTWIDDPSNADTSFDRNYLRHLVVPVLRERWPGAGQTVGRAARLNTEAMNLLQVLAELDCRQLLRAQAVDLTALRQLDSARQRNVIRFVLKDRGLTPPGEAQLKVGLEQLLSAGPDRGPVLSWSDGQIHRYRDKLYVLNFDPVAAAEALPSEYSWDGSGEMEMGPLRGRLRLVKEAAGGVAIPSAAGRIAVRFRHGGERIREVDQPHHKALKKLFQEHGIVPWMRGHVPLLYDDERLLAVGDLWIAAEAVAPPGEAGYRILWENHPVTQ
jgi:tRNA(Ile)-lysidine synthase